MTDWKSTDLAQFIPLTELIFRINQVVWIFDLDLAGVQIDAITCA